MTFGQLNALIVDDPIEAWHAAGLPATTSSPLAPPRSSRPRRAKKNAVMDIARALLAHRSKVLVNSDGLALGSWVPTEATNELDHPNGVVAIDHVVVMTPDSDRTTATSKPKALRLDGYARFLSTLATVARPSFGSAT